MINYIIKRLLLMVPALLGISIVIFLMVRLAPGNPLVLAAQSEGGGLQVDPKYRDALLAMKMRMYGLDKPLHVQYFQWMGRVVRLDFGESITEHRPVITMIKERMWLTIKLNAVSDFLIYLLAVPLGLLAAQSRYAGAWRRGLLDTGSGVGLLIFYSIPGILLATLLIIAVAKGGWLDDYVKAGHPGWNWLVMPIGGVASPGTEQLSYWAYLRDVAWHFVLPVITMTVGGWAYLAKLARSSLLENMRQDYVRTAYAKGLPERSVVYVHALRNSLLPLLTILPMLLPAMFGGSVIIETIFNLPGLGKLFYEAILRRDYEMIQAQGIIAAGLLLVAILISDILYAVVDPRVRYD